MTTVVDGDTVAVDVFGDGTSTPVTIRNAGIQATEMNRQTTNVPDCHAVPAFSAMKALLPVGTRVRLGAWYVGSTSSATDGAGRARPIRYVDRIDVDRSGHRTYLDVQKALVAQGHAMWKTEPVEKGRDATYHLPMRQAMVKRVNLWDPGACGSGPQQTAALRMYINYEADGDDSKNLNGEHVRIQNLGASDVTLTGWKLRDASQGVARDGSNRTLAYFTFPTGSLVRAHGYVTVYPTKAAQDPGHGRFFLNEPMLPFFPNVTDSRLGYPGKAIYLQDPRTSGSAVGLDIRATADYPCLASCSRPPVHIASVQPRGTEEVDVTLNPGVTSRVDLSGVVVGNDGWVKELAPGTYLNPGETMRVFCGTGSGSRPAQYWGRPAGTSMLEDAGDTVVLRTAESTVLSTYRYGTG